ncbi:hypothetical protein BDR07DRAFT_1412401 [Suillus spraguei]|nr:hypothetical protein BDR07DRAFT_1412401 [Suillus spraguei]
MSENIPAVVDSSVPFYISIEVRFTATGDSLQFGTKQRTQCKVQSRYRVSLFVHCQHHAICMLPRKTTTKFSFNRNDIWSNTFDVIEYRTTKGNMIVVIAISAVYWFIASEAS